MKVCSRCHKTLPDSDFHENGMVYLQCNSCREKRRKYRENRRKSSSLTKPVNNVPKKKSKVCNEKAIDFFVESIIQKQATLTFCGLCLEDDQAPHYTLIRVTGDFNPFNIILKNDLKTLKISDFAISRCKNLVAFSEQCIETLKKEGNKDYSINNSNFINETCDSLEFLRYLIMNFKNSDKSNDFMKIFEILIGVLIYSKEDKNLMDYMNFEEKAFEFENIPEDDED